jgi:carbamoyltransferase
MSRWTLGISASHNGSACLLKDDEIVVAIQEERLNRKKRSRLLSGQPSLAVSYCLQTAGIEAKDLDAIGISSDASPRSRRNDPRFNLQLQEAQVPIYYTSHHAAHAYSVFATSGFRSAAILVVDGKGSHHSTCSADELAVAPGDRTENDYEAFSMYRASGVEVEPVFKQIGKDWFHIVDGVPTFNTLGGMFSALAKQMFNNPMDAGKVMGLAPYGKPTDSPDSFFTKRDGLLHFESGLLEPLKGAPSWPAQKEVYQNLAASAQEALEEALLGLMDDLHERTGLDQVCYTGGVALNCVANERIIRESKFRDVFILPAAEDSGPSIGSAYYALWKASGSNTQRPLVHDALGRRYTSEDALKAASQFPWLEVVEQACQPDQVAALIADRKILGWFHGGAELGPRALGQRSILCDPRREDGKEVLNLRVKHREAFRPFAPVTLQEKARDWFEIEAGISDDSPFMLRVCNFKEERKKQVPAVVHVDGTGRLQTVAAERNGELYHLVRAFESLTGVPMLLNTSFNVMGEPIVETPTDALWCMSYTGIDYCVLEGVLIRKKSDYKTPLQLVPVLREAELAVRLKVKAGEGFASHEVQKLETGVHTPYGHITGSLPVNAFAVLNNIDGTRTGYDLCDRLQEQGMDHPSLTRLLGELFRARLIGLKLPAQ